MAVASGSCPSCGAPIEFGLGSSIAKVCEYCNATVARSDRGLEDLGKVAAIANTPSLIEVGDQGEIDGRRFQVLGRVQLDHGQGPWDEYYVAFDQGDSWGWLAYAEGHWLVTRQAHGLSAPAFTGLRLEESVDLNDTRYCITEIKTGRVVSAQGELPNKTPPGQVRHYADLLAPNNAAATLDYGENQGSYEVFLGWVVEESRLKVIQAGPRSQAKVKTDMIKCPNCGGDVPKLNGERSKRIGCPYCGAVSDIALQQIIAQQDAARAQPDIPIGAHGLFDDIEYICIAYIQRSALFDGERFSWDEYLLFSHGLGYRWLVKDETTWLWTSPANPAEIDKSQLPASVSWGARTFNYRNQQETRVDYVLGEVYWQVQVGETTRASDFVNKQDILSREEGPGEVRWSFSVPVPWPILATGFQLPEDGSGGVFSGGSGASGNSAGINPAGIVALVVLLILLAICCAMCAPCSSGVGGIGGPRVYGGTGYYGGK